MIEGISHITFIVKDLDKATNFFKSIFDAKEVYNSGDKKHSSSREKFLLINNIWIAIMEGESLKEKTYNHIAFKIPKSELKKYVERVKVLGVKIRNPRTRIKGESNSIYFYDFDNHLFEIHTGKLDERLSTYNSI